MVDQTVAIEDAEAVVPVSRSNQRNLFETAYRRLEAMIANCTLEPGRHLTMQHMQELTGLGRTPVHQAVTRLAADTLIIVRPRHGLQVAPIRIERERSLLGLRRNLERFVVELATEQATTLHRNQMLALSRAMRAGSGKIDADEFNTLDARLNALVIAAAAEPFLEHTLRPLHSMFRRIGYLYLSRISQGDGLIDAIANHVAVLEAVAARDVKTATTALDALIGAAGRMLDRMEREIDAELLDCSIREDDQ